MRGPEGRGEVEVAVSGIAGLQCSVYSMQIIELLWSNASLQFPSKHFILNNNELHTIQKVVTKIIADLLNISFRSSITLKFARAVLFCSSSTASCRLVKLKLLFFF
jgi:hypothetical protein